MDEIITKVKVMVGIIMKIKGEEDGEQYLNSLAKKYNLDNNFIERIKEQQIKPTRITRDFISSIQSKTGTETFKEAKEADFEVGTSELAKVFNEEFNLTFFRKSINMLRLGMETITKAEQEAIIQYCEKNKFEKTTDKDGKITYKKGDETICIRTDTSHLDTQAQKLRDKIRIDTLKVELEQVRQTGNNEEIAKKEIQVTNIILEAIYNYPYQNTNGYGYQVNKILKHKEIYCVGFALLGHAFLSELGITHKGLNILKHSALEVNIGGKRYYFDATFSKKILEFEYGNTQEIYSKINFINNDFTNEAIALPGNAEKILLSQIYKNKGADLFELKQYDEAIKMCDTAIELNPQDADAYYNKGTALFGLKKYDEAIKMCDTAIELNPQDADAYYNKGTALFGLKKYDEAIKMYDTAIELNPQYVDAYYNKGADLFKLKQYEEAIKMYNIAIELNPQYVNAYYSKCVVLGITGKTKTAKLYYFTVQLMKGKEPFVLNPLNLFFREEKTKIRQLIQDKNYERLREYLLTLEAEDKK